MNLSQGRSKKSCVTRTFVFGFLGFPPTHSFLCIYVCMHSARALMHSCAGRPAGVRNACIPLRTHVQLVRSPLHSIHLAHKRIRLLSKRAASVLLSWGCKYLVCCINTAAFKECRVRKRQKCFIPTPDNRKTEFVDSYKRAARGATKISAHSFETMFLVR